MRGSRRAHDLARFYGNYADATVRKLPRRDPGAGTDVGGDDRRSRAEAVEDGVDGSRRIVGTILDVIVGAIVEARDRLIVGAIVEARDRLARDVPAHFGRRALS
jgi:hypothetical protein